MSEEEKAKAIEELVKAHKKAIAERKKAEVTEGFLNPFGKETSYKEFLKAVEDSKKSTADYCKGKLSKDELAWLEKDIEIYKSENKE